MSRYDTVLFDLDGTLTDPGEGITNSVAYALRHYGITPPPREDLYPFIGPPLVDSFMTRYGFSAEKAHEAVEVYREYFRAKGMFENEVYPGIPEVLRTLKDAGKTLIVASSKPEPFVRQILDHFDLSGSFAFIGGSTLEETRTSKPEVIAYVLEQCGISDRSRAVMAGDRKYDILGAHEIGMAAIGVTYGYGSEAEIAAAQPEYTAGSPEDLSGIVLSE